MPTARDAALTADQNSLGLCTVILRDRDDLIPLGRVLGRIQMTVQIGAGLPGATMVIGFVSVVTVGGGLSPVLDAG
jgi:hypothetical protein